MSAVGLSLFTILQYGKTNLLGVFVSRVRICDCIAANVSRMILLSYSAQYFYLGFNVQKYFLDLLYNDLCNKNYNSQFCIDLPYYAFNWILKNVYLKAL